MDLHFGLGPWVEYLKLPKADSGWELANLFFKSELSTSDINRGNLNETIASMKIVQFTTILQKIMELLRRITRKTTIYLKSMENLS